eukprot:NODE_389_length_9467_cov_0.241567.p6 type:complete len:148 gc:universal NODE_389_length_9467_cov_0.241567:3750-4193(+)
MGSLYELLGVPTYASKAAIKAAFYKLSKEHHPDMLSGNHDRFKDIQNAYSLLMDDERRRVYDSKNPAKRSFTQRTAYPNFSNYDLKYTRPYKHHYPQNPFYDKFHAKKRQNEFERWRDENTLDRSDNNYRFVIGLCIFSISLLMLNF